MTRSQTRALKLVTNKRQIFLLFGCSSKESRTSPTGLVCRVGAWIQTVLAELLLLTLDQAQFAPQALAVCRQDPVVLKQLAVLLDQPR